MPLTNVAYSFEEELPHKTLTIPRLLGTSTGWYRTTRPLQLNHIVIYYAPRLSSNNSIFIHQCSLLWLQQQTPSREAGINLARNVPEIGCKYLCSYL
jgi:hypothetical protein